MTSFEHLKVGDEVALVYSIGSRGRIVKVTRVGRTLLDAGGVTVYRSTGRSSPSGFQIQEVEAYRARVRSAEVFRELAGAGLTLTHDPDRRPSMAALEEVLTVLRKHRPEQTKEKVMINLKTLSKPRRELLAAVRDGRVHMTDDWTNTRVFRELPEFRRVTVSQSTWKALRDAGLIQYQNPPPGRSVPVALSETGARLLAGEDVNTVSSLALRFAIGDQVIERRVLVPERWWGLDSDKRDRIVRSMQERMLRDMVSLSWAESDLAPEENGS